MRRTASSRLRSTPTRKSPPRPDSPTSHRAVVGPTGGCPSCSPGRKEVATKSRSIPSAAMAGQPTSRRRAGDDAEEAVARHLLASGWTIVARNVRVGRGELDIVAVEPDPAPPLVFVEVRSASGTAFGDPIE